MSLTFGGARIAAQLGRYRVPRGHIPLWHFVEHPIGFRDVTKSEMKTLGRTRPNLEFPTVISESAVIICLWCTHLYRIRGEGRARSVKADDEVL